MMWTELVQSGVYTLSSNGMGALVIVTIVLGFGPAFVALAVVLTRGPAQNLGLAISESPGIPLAANGSEPPRLADKGVILQLGRGRPGSRAA